MKMRTTAVAVACVAALVGSIGISHADPLNFAVARPMDDTSATDAMALATALNDKKFELSGLFGTDLRLTVGLDLWLNQWQTGIFVSNNQSQGFRNET